MPFCISFHAIMPDQLIYKSFSIVLLTVSDVERTDSTSTSEITDLNEKLLRIERMQLFQTTVGGYC